MYPYEKEESLFITTNFRDFFLDRATKELENEMSTLIGYADYGYNHDTDTDDMYLYIDGDYESLLFDSGTELFVMCDCAHFDKTERYEVVYNDFLEKLRAFVKDF